MIPGLRKGWVSIPLRTPPVGNRPRSKGWVSLPLVSKRKRGLSRADASKEAVNRIEDEIIAIYRGGVNRSSNLNRLNRLNRLSKLFRNENLNINIRDDYGQTLLMRQSIKQRRDAVEILLTIPDIFVEDSIKLIDNQELKSDMIKLYLTNDKKRRRVESSISGGVNNKGRESEKCDWSRRDYLGLCYIMSVITLFRNEKNILTMLNKNINSFDGRLQKLIKLLSKNYEDSFFEDTCPLVPPDMISAVTNNYQRFLSSPRGPLNKNGGSPFTIMAWIMHSINIFSDKKIKAWIIFPGKFTIDTLRLKVEDFTHNNYKGNIGYIEFNIDYVLDIKFTKNLKNICTEQ